MNSRALIKNLGPAFGGTDEIGYNAIGGKRTAFDIQLTVLNQVGFDYEKFTAKK